MSKSYIIRDSTLVEIGNSLHLQKVDILIVDGTIVEISSKINADGKEVVGNNLYVSAGWVDLRCHLTDPGNEHKDSLENLLDSAAAGGFTSVVTLPHSEPPISDKSSVKYLTKSAENHVVNLLPTGVLSATENTENLAELYDMNNAGAVAFTNGDQAVSNGLLKKALLYTKPFGARVITHPSDKSLEQGGLVNESDVTVHTGLKTSSSLAEYLNISEQIEVARYCEASLHFSAISTEESVNLIRTAQSEGVKVTCDVAIANLCFSDQEVLSFDENFKIYPPLRSESDRQALIAGVNDGTIDAICSNHCPQNIESKQVEFDYAEYGSLALQQVYPWYLKHLSNDIELEKFIEVVTVKPSNFLGQESSSISKGMKANLTIFDKDKVWKFDSSNNKSTSNNSHEWNEELTGGIVAVFNNNLSNRY
ncbi:MAG: dihydroorotase [Bacteroidetes bacterium]|nr:MAG: dihydroorotase [Bacteroidota bacterium]